MHVAFVTSVFRELLDDGTLSTDDTFVAVAAGANEAALFSSVGIAEATITNLDTSGGDDAAPYRWDHQAAQRLTYPDASFDWAVVVDGLHHCPSPHAALGELYRVARKGIIAVEARDSALMRAAIRLGLTGRYEVEAVVAHHGTAGGVDNTAIPNHVYRWTEAELVKTVRSLDPTGEPSFRFFGALHLPWQAAGMRRRGRKRWVLRLASPVLHAVTKVAKRQRNTLAMVVVKPTELHPWLRRDATGEIVFDLDHARRHYR